MKSINTFSALIFFVFSFTLNKNLYAQVPGYLGKTCSIQFDLNTEPALYGPTQSNKGLSDNLFGYKEKELDLSYRLGFTISKAISKTTNLIFECDNFKTGMREKYISLTGGNKTTGSDFYFDIHDCFHLIEVKSVGIGAQYFSYKNRGAIAPLGFYLAPSIGISVIKGEIIDRHSKINPLSNGVINPFPISQNTQLGYVKFEVGKNYIVADRIIINFSVNTKLYTALFTTPKPNELSENYNAEYKYDKIIDENLNQKNYNYKLMKRLLAHDFFSGKIGIGFLIF